MPAADTTPGLARAPAIAMRSRERLTARAGRITARASLLGLVALSLLVVASAAERPSFLAPTSHIGYFPAWMAGPLGGVWSGLTHSYSGLVWLSSALLVAMFALYLIACATVSRLAPRWTIAALLTIHAIFLLAPPLSYTDVFNYIGYGRMGALHHLNPYVTVPLLAPHGDPSYPLSNWHLLLSPYGPLFTLFSYALVPLGVVGSFWALKAALALASLATLALLWRCAQMMGRSPAACVVFMGCNPIVLVWGLGADHNDILMMFFVVLCVYLLLRTPRAAAAAGAALVAAAFVKASAAVLLPLLVFAGERARFLRGAVAGALALGSASLLAFGPHLPGLSTQSRLVTAIGIPNLVGLALGLGGETAGLRAVFAVALVVTIAVCALWCARRRSAWPAACATTMLALLVSLSWTAPWYLLWALPFAALSGSRTVRGATVLLGAYLILAFMPAAVTLSNTIGFYPTATPLGHLHREAVEALVR